MRVRLKIALPLVGLFIFSTATYHSFHRQRELDRTPSRYFWWSAIRLDSDPANKKYKSTSTTSCKDVHENCGTWEDLRDRWVDPALVEQFLMLSAFPAFVIGRLAVTGLGKLGISQVSSFMLVMPVLIFAWYYFIGWLFDGWIHGWSRRSTPVPG
jgi:hypothetical protein